MTWNIVADSSCDLTESIECTEDVEFATVPLKIIVDGKEFVDDQTLDVSEMMAAMDSFKGASSTACPSPEEWAEQFRKADCSVAVTITSGLSGTYNSAVVGKNMVLEQNPEKKIHVIDTKSTAGCMTLVAKRINTLIAAGNSFEQVVDKAEAYCSQLMILFSLSSFDNLMKTGRMSKLAGMLAGILSIRAVAKNNSEGKIDVIQKCRGEAKAIAYMVDMLGKVKPMENLPVIVSHCGNMPGAKRLKFLIEQAYSGCQVTIQACRGLTSFYAEKGGLLISF